MNPATTLRVLGPEPWRVAYVEPSRRPTDGRYGENPNRLQHYYQYQVIIQPAPDNIQELYIESLKYLGIDPAEHDIRFVEDDWENPTTGAWGLGWEVWLDGMEITQFTYFQQMGAVDMDVVPAELTYGLERITMFVQKVNNVYDLQWVDNVTYGDVATYTTRARSSIRPTTSRSPTPTCSSSSSTSTRPSRKECSRRGLCFPPTTTCSSARIRSTCSTRATR